MSVRSEEEEEEEEDDGLVGDGQDQDVVRLNINQLTQAQ